MARTAKLTYHKARRQWRKKKKIDGRDRYWYLGRSGVNKTDATAYQEALEEWQKIEAGLEDRTGERIERLGYDPREYGWKLDDHEQMADTLKAHHQGADKPTAKTVGGIIDDFLKHFQALAKTGGRKQNTYDSLKPRLEGFRDWLGEDTPVTDLNAATLARYHTHLLERMTAAKPWSPQYAHDHLRAAKQVTRWAWQQEIIENLPRNLDTLHINVPIKTPETIKPAHIHRIIDAAEGRPRLYIALALLCGMTARDMAALKHSELDLKAGRLTRKRSKTQRHKGVPTVGYKLPAPVVKLLKEHAAEGTDDDPVLLTETGRPLVHGQRNDSVRLCFDRLLKRINKQAEEAAEEQNEKRKKEGKKPVEPDTITASMKMMRATSANMLEKQDRFKPVVTLWLGHSPRSIAERHYTTGDAKLLDKAVGWLAEQYGLDTEQAAQPAKKTTRKKKATKAAA